MYLCYVYVCTYALMDVGPSGCLVRLGFDSLVNWPQLDNQYICICTYEHMYVYEGCA